MILFCHVRNLVCHHTYEAIIRLARADQLVCEDISGECVIYDGRQKKAHHLNSTLTWIWHRCDGNTSIEALASDSSSSLNVTNGLDVLMTGLEQLEARDLLEPSTEMSGFLAIKEAL